MNKQTLVNVAYEVVGTPSLAREVVQAIFSRMREALRNEETITVEGFGKWVPKRTKPRKRMAFAKPGSPPVGTVMVPSKRRVCFFQSKEFFPENKK